MLTRHEAREAKRQFAGKPVQRELRAHGWQFQRHVRTLPGRRNIVFRKEKVAMFVDGDFWHSWRLPAGKHKLSPLWCDKLRADRFRDQRNFRHIRVGRWPVVRLWQHEALRHVSACGTRIVRA